MQLIVRQSNHHCESKRNDWLQSAILIAPAWLQMICIIEQWGWINKIAEFCRQFMLNSINWRWKTKIINDASGSIIVETYLEHQNPSGSYQSKEKFITNLHRHRYEWNNFLHFNFDIMNNDSFYFSSLNKVFSLYNSLIAHSHPHVTLIIILNKYFSIELNIN